jgi:uncharacterized protein (TIGR02246 family)
MVLADAIDSRTSQLAAIEGRRTVGLDFLHSPRTICGDHREAFVSHPLAVLFSFALLIPAASSFLGGAQPAETAGHAADEAAIKAVVDDRWMGGWNAHDARRFSSMFASDADFTNVRGQSASGQADIEKFHAVAFERFFKQSHQTGEVTKIRFLRPDLAAVDIRWEMTGAVDNTGNPSPYRTGLANCIFIKSGGDWLVAIMHNTELTPWVQPPQK